MRWMYIMGIRKWYFNWLLWAVSFGVCMPLFIYMVYRQSKVLSQRANGKD